MSEKKQIWVASTFWDDHCDRCPSDKGADGLASEIRRQGARVLVEGNVQQIRCLYSDAAFYTDRDGPDETPPSILNSARRVRLALEKAGFQ